jgi:hypothetical protein
LQSVTYAPTDTTNYNTATSTVGVTVNKAAPSVTAWPVASPISYGQTLAASTLSGGSATPAGSFAFTTPSTAPSAGTAMQSVTYAPTDTTNYNTASGTESVTVSKAAPSVTAWPVASPISYGQTLAASTLSGGSATPPGSFAFATPSTAPSAGTALQSVTYAPTDATNYNTASSMVGVTVSPKPLTVTGVTASNKAYDGSTSATLNTTGANLVGIVSPDVVTLNTAGATGAFTNPDVGTAKAVLVSGLSLSGADAGNYTLTQPTTSASITAAGLTVTGIQAPNKVYDGTNSATLMVSNAVLVGVLGGDTVTLDPTNAVGVFADKNVGTRKRVTVSSLTLLGADAAKYTLTQPTTNADITAASLTVTGIVASDKVYDGTVSVMLDTNSAALNGVITGDDVTLELTAAAGAFAAPNAGTGQTVLVSGLTLSGMDAGNYALMQPTLTATITPADPVVTTWPTASAITYGQTLAASTLSGGSATPAGSFAFTTPSTAPNAGTALQSVTYAPTDTTNYNTASGTVSVTVNKAAPSVTAWPVAGAISYGQTLAASTLSGGSATPAGSFAFTTPSTAPSAGTALQSVTYAPTDTADYTTVSSTANVTVNKASSATALVSSANPSLQGSEVTFTATVTPVALLASGTPTGNVQFYTNEVASGSPVALTDGVASLSTTNLPAGTNTVLAAYQGDSNYLANSNSLLQVVAVVVGRPSTPSTIGIQNNGDGTVTVTFAGTPDAQYVVQAADNLTPTGWENISTNTAGTDGQWTFTESAEHHRARFYRSARP